MKTISMLAMLAALLIPASVAQAAEPRQITTEAHLDALMHVTERVPAFILLCEPQQCVSSEAQLRQHAASFEGNEAGFIVMHTTDFPEVAQGMQAEGRALCEQRQKGPAADRPAVPCDQEPSLPVYMGLFKNQIVVFGRGPATDEQLDAYIRATTGLSEDGSHQQNAPANKAPTTGI